MARRLSSGAVQAAIRTKLHQDAALEQSNFKAALGLGLVANAENRRGMHLADLTQERRDRIISD
jgi:hypothetical protein